MGRSPCCSSKGGLNRGAWTSHEDKLLTDYIKINGEGRWSSLPNRAGLKRCGKSCCLRWMNYLRPDIKRGSISPDEEDLIIRLHKLLGNRWSLITGRLPGRRGNEIKNYWNTHRCKRTQNHTNISSSAENQTQNRLEKPTKKITPFANNDNNSSWCHSVITRTRADKCTRTFVDPPESDGISTLRGSIPSFMAGGGGENDGSALFGDLMVDFDSFMHEFNFSNLLDFSVSDDYGYHFSSISADKSLVQSDDNGNDSVVEENLDLNNVCSFASFIDTKEDLARKLM